MGTPYLISVFLHIVLAAFWIGSMLFWVLVLLPVIRNNNDRVLLLHTTGIKFRLYGWITLAGLLTTGIYNMYVKGMPFTREFLIESPYGRLLGYKLLAFALVLVVGGLHDFYIGNKAIEQMKKDEHNRLRYIARWSGRINLLLALIIAFLGVAISRGGFY